MTRQEKYPDTKWFHYHNENPKNRLTAGDCTFRAIATATGKAWADVVMEMAQLSCKTGYAINDKHNIEKYLANNGWTKQKQPRHQDNTKFTGKEFCELLQDVNELNRHKTDKVIALVGSAHIVAIMNGRVNDTWDSTDGCIGNYWLR